MQFIPCVHAFYAFESPLFYNHHNREGNVIVTPSTMGAHQGDPLAEALFTLTHFRALCFIVSHYYLFPSIADDIHIINPPSIVLSVHEHFQTKLHTMCLSIQPKKMCNMVPF